MYNDCDVEPQKHKLELEELEDLTINYSFKKLIINEIRY